MALYTSESRGSRARRGRLRRAGLRAHRAAPRRPGTLRGAVPVPRGAHALVRDRPGAEGLLLLRLPGRRATCSRSCRRPRASTSKARWSCSPTAAGSSWSASRRTRARPSAARARERLLELLARTSAYYERCLWESNEAARAREYLQGRGLGEEILREFRVGYAPSAWDRVLHGLAPRRVLRGRSCTRPAWRSARRRTGGPYDRFRSRIMFPLADIRGRVLGFGARAMREEQRPKYLNTSDNDVYHKGLHLYGADLARAHAAARGAGDPVRGLHRRDRAAPGRACATRSG